MQHRCFGESQTHIHSVDRRVDWQTLELRRNASPRSPEHDQIEKTHGIELPHQWLYQLDSSGSSPKFLHLRLNDGKRDWNAPGELYTQLGSAIRNEKTNLDQFIFLPKNSSTIMCIVQCCNGSMRRGRVDKMDKPVVEWFSFFGFANIYAIYFTKWTKEAFQVFFCAKE